MIQQQHNTVGRPNAIKRENTVAQYRDNFSNKRQLGSCWDVSANTFIWSLSSTTGALTVTAGSVAARTVVAVWLLACAGRRTFNDKFREIAIVPHAY